MCARGCPGAQPRAPQPGANTYSLSPAASSRPSTSSIFSGSRPASARANISSAVNLAGPSVGIRHAATLSLAGERSSDRPASLARVSDEVSHRPNEAFATLAVEDVTVPNVHDPVADQTLRLRLALRARHECAREVEVSRALAERRSSGNGLASGSSEMALGSSIPSSSSREGSRHPRCPSAFSERT